MKEVHFFSKPSAKELTEMDIQCFDSPWSEKDYLEMEKISFFNGWLLGFPERNFVGILAFNILFQEVEILRLGVHPRWRGIGLAQLMLDRLESESKKKNVISIFLEVNCFNFPAISLYRKKGFEDIGIRKKINT